MPQGDRTGPDGRGPRTGRGMGFCSGANQPGFMNSGFGREFGRGRGVRQGRYAKPYAESVSQPATLTKEQQKKILEAEAVELEVELKAIKEKLKDLE